jgi:hypothetical protein
MNIVCIVGLRRRALGRLLLLLLLLLGLLLIVVNFIVIVKHKAYLELLGWVHVDVGLVFGADCDVVVPAHLARQQVGVRETSVGLGRVFAIGFVCEIRRLAWLAAHRVRELEFVVSFFVGNVLE